MPDKNGIIIINLNNHGNTVAFCYKLMMHVLNDKNFLLMPLVINIHFVSQSWRISLSANVFQSSFNGIC